MKRLDACIIAAVLLSSPMLRSCTANEIAAKVILIKSQHIVLTIQAPPASNDDTCTIYRSHVDIDQLKVLDLNAMPISRYRQPLENSACIFTDSLHADNSTYYYYVKVYNHSRGRNIASNIVQINTPDKMLPLSETRSPSIFIDKLNYFLELRFSGIGVKRYPVSFGRLPRNRKLCYDLRSTPEGKYRVAYRWPKATFYKAFGVSYPNATDHRRYRNAVTSGRIMPVDGELPGIGGSIQIHGGGVDGNWTFGCIAMRNDDIDELFSVPTLKSGSPLYIVGEEISRRDLFPPHPDNL